jgi:hypothetical protein
MPRRELLGQEAVIRQVSDLLADRQSVLLFGPEAIGKTAIIAAVAREGITVVDPFERISGQAACDMRRALDHGAVFLAASRVPHGRQLGSVGRISWRFSRVRVRELPDPILGRIVAGEIAGAERDTDAAWLREIVALARGRPGFASAMGRFAKEWKDGHGYLPLPGLAFAVTREDTAIRALRATTTSRPSPRRLEREI